MILKITSKRQVTFPKRVLETLGLDSGDRIELVENTGGYLLRARRIDESMLAPLKGRLPRGEGTFDVARFRDEAYDTALRD